MELELLLLKEAELVNNLETHIAEEEAKVNRLKIYLAELRNRTKHALENTSKYIGNPINAYKLVRRFTTVWQEVKQLVRDDPEADGVNRLTKVLVNQRKSLPSAEDVSGAAAALLRLQETYDLVPSEMIKGDIAGVGPTNEKLSPTDCFEIGRQAYLIEDWKNGVVWFNESLYRLDNLVGGSIEQKALILDYYAYSLFKLGDVTGAHAMTSELLTLEPSDSTRISDNLQFYASILPNKIVFGVDINHTEKHSDIKIEDSNKYVEILEDKYFDPSKLGEDADRSVTWPIYLSLCRGTAPPLNPSLISQLHCRNVASKNPRLVLRPPREEELYLDPRIVVFHDIISDKEMGLVKQLGSSRLQRATVQRESGRYEPADYRVQKSGWLSDTDHEVLEHLFTRMEDITGLSLETAESLQVGNYGIGGQYEPHLDFSQKKGHADDVMEIDGNRIATMLLYLSDVERGGATVFTNIGVRVEPARGSAAFWYNLHRSGDGDTRTRHAGCPVLAGDKWVANEWFHERGQEFRRPCHKDRITING